MKKLMKGIALTLLVLNVSTAWSQDDRAKLDDLMRKDSADINALASYPDSTRHNIFLVSTEPNGLSKLAAIQKKTNDDFKNLVSSYSKDDQQKVWNLTRYDNLISQLAIGGQKSNDQIEAILKNYPQDVHDDGLNFGLNHYDLLVSINNVNQSFSDSYNDIMKDYPAETQTAYSQLMNLPEVLSIMTGNIEMTTGLGNIYRTSPALVKQQFDSLNLQLARQKAQDTQAWKDSLSNNPEAMTELQASAQDYAKSNGANTNAPPPTPEMVASYQPQPYPYWAGYPTWYGPDYWYPHPYWYDCGFYSYGGGVVFIGVPTYHFAYWGFNHYPHYFYAYPHLSNLYFNRYYGPNRSAAIYNADSRYSARVINNWSVKNQSALPNGFLANDPSRVDRIRELGQAEMDRRQYNKANPTAKINRQDYMNQHLASYPHMQAAANNEMRMNPNGAARPAQGGQQRMSSGPTPVYQSPQRENTNTNNGNGRQQQNGRRQGNVQQRQMNQPRQQMQRQQSQQRSQPAQRAQPSEREEGGRKH